MTKVTQKDVHFSLQTFHQPKLHEFSSTFHTTLPFFSCPFKYIVTMLIVLYNYTACKPTGMILSLQLHFIDDSISFITALSHTKLSFYIQIN